MTGSNLTGPAVKASVVGQRVRASEIPVNHRLICDDCNGSRPAVCASVSENILNFRADQQPLLAFLEVPHSEECTSPQDRLIGGVGRELCDHLLGQTLDIIIGKNWFHVLFLAGQARDAAQKIRPARTSQRMAAPDSSRLKRKAPPGSIGGALGRVLS
jgi:hypothetical protein